MTNSIFYKIYFYISSILKSHVYFGKSPTTVPDGSLIIFPCRLDRSCCGFIGILEYKGKTKRDQEKDTNKVHTSLISGIKGFWPQISRNGLKRLMEGQISEGAYLDGERSLAGFMDGIIALKGIKIFEYIFKDTKAQKEIRELINDMNTFLSEEDVYLDKAGSKIDSSALEMVKAVLIPMP